MGSDVGFWVGMEGNIAAQQLHGRSALRVAKEVVASRKLHDGAGHAHHDVQHDSHRHRVAERAQFLTKYVRKVSADDEERQIEPERIGNHAPAERPS